MLNPKKVIARESSTVKDRKKIDQRNYEVKVYDLLIACNNFVSYLRAENEIYYARVSYVFNRAFKKQLKKNRMLSRTSRVLNKMSKELAKFKGKFAPEDLEKYSKVFDYKPKKADEKNYIKRSAIDDKGVVKAFTQTIPAILKAKAKAKRAKEIKENQKSKEEKSKYLKELFKKSHVVLSEKGDFKSLSTYQRTLKEVSFGNKVKEVDEAAFQGFARLTKVSLGESCQKIGSRAFAACVELQNIDLSKVTEIGANAFYGCRSLQQIDLSSIKNAEAIGNGAFSHCDSLKSVILPPSSNRGQEVRARGIKIEVSKQVGVLLSKLIIFTNDPDKIKK